ncbi:MAG: hypothetical protein K8R50_02055 [Betaproteobacteria bacterium]|nr:hypothetical protein [Betaproteobacteria bacterium]MCX7195818.1 hypothetical protein [Pseudomonadota bacterium]
MVRTIDRPLRLSAKNMLNLCSHFGFDPVDSSWYLPEGSHVPSSQTQPGIHALLAAFGTCSTSRYPTQQ